MPLNYLEEALAAARSALSHRDFAVIAQAARDVAGSLSSRSRMTPIEKSLLLGPAQLTAQELWDAVARADEMAAADMRRNLDVGCAAIAKMLKREVERRDHVTKDDPGSSDVHVSTTAQGKPKKKPEEGEIAVKKADDEALQGARLAALAAQGREAGEAAIPSAPMYIESVDYPVVTLISADGIDLQAALKSESALEIGDIVEISCDMNGALVVEGPSASVVAAKYDQVRKALEDSLDARRHKTPVPFIGPESARVVFVAGAPSDLELARLEPMVGPNGVVFAERYLAPLGVTKSEVAIGFACPVLPRVEDDEISSKETGAWKEYVTKELSRWPDAVVVALGLPAREALGEQADFWLPHPTAARLNEARYEEQVGRKLRQVAKALDGTDPIGETSVHRVARPDGTTPEILTGRVGETLVAGASNAVMRVAKAADEKQIVSGVVLDPYEIDTQGEWVPPATVEATAHDYVKKSRVIGREHRKPANAEMVESWIVPYPSQQDYDNAMAGLSHKAYEMPYGDDTVHSGAWIMGVQLGDAEWSAYKAKEITGFSIGGFSSKTKVSKSAMPTVEFVPLSPVVK